MIAVVLGPFEVGSGVVSAEISLEVVAFGCESSVLALDDVELGESEYVGTSFFRPVV